MSIFKDLLFLHGHLHDTRFADPPRSYSQGYGTKAAASEAFPPVRGGHGRRERRAAAPAPVPAACGGR